MANDNMVGLNLATRAGEGGADVMSWNYLDNVNKQLYAEQKQKEAQAVKDFSVADELLKKDIGGIRSADNDEIFNKYNKVKELRKALYFDEKAKKDPKKFAELQRLAQLEENDLRQSILESKEVKELDKGVTQRIGSHRDDFDDEKIPTFYQALQLPTSERRKLGLIGDTPYRYQGVDMSKLGQIAKTAMGTPKEVPFGDAVEADGGYKLEQKTLVRGNNPLQYADLLYKGLQSNKYGQGARSLYSQMPEERKQQIRKQFLDIPDADFESKWGVKKENLLSMFNNDDKAGQYVMLDAMKYAVDNMPQFGQSKFRPNEAFKTEQNKDEWNRRNAITSRQAASRAATVAAGKDAQPIVDVWGGIVESVNKSKSGAIAFNELEPNAQEILLEFAKKSGKDLSQEEVTVYKNKNGGYELREVETVKRNGKDVAVVGKLITPISQQVVNLQGQPSVQEKRKVIGGGKSSQKSAKKYKGLDKNGNPIFE
jgi:ribosomal protein S6